MNDNNIHIHITRGQPGEMPAQRGAPKSEVSFAPTATPPVSPNDGMVNNLRGGAINTALVSLGKRALDYGLSNYGNLTGDHIGQARINETLEVAGLIGMAVAGGWVGVAAAVGAVAIKAVNRYVDVKKSEIQSNAMRIRTGASRDDY